LQQFVNHNGEIVDSNTPVFTANNRAFLYGDALFETIRVVKGVPLFFEDHFHRLLSGMMVLQMKFERTLDLNYFKDQIVQLAAVNKHEDAARVRMEFYRKAGGYYTPENNDIGFLIQTEKLEQAEYRLNPKGLKVDVYKDQLKPVGLLSNLKTCNSLLFILAGIYKTQKGLDDSLLLNSRGTLSESLSSNIFIVVNGVLLTPPLQDACVAGVMRNQIFKIAKKRNKKIIEKSISVDDLLAADEIFLTNAISGIRWVVAFRHKRYFNTMAKWLAEELNTFATEVHHDRE
jgi:branched-subunit amino acid aminotransferase/4-amino-4-deoxychorismate lyase